MTSFIVSLMLISFIGCQTVQRDLAPAQTEGQQLFWPPPPQNPRIQYIKSIRSPEDINITQSWIQKTLSTVFGKEVEAKIMLRPYGIYAAAGRIYVTDPGMHVLHVFDEQKNHYFRIQKAKDTELVSPIGIAVDKNGDIYLSDSILKEIFVFDKDGTFLREIGSPDSYMRPTGIALLEERLYVVDTLGHRILSYNKNNGNFLFSFGKNGTGYGDFHYPTHICTGKDSLLYIIDSLNFRVQLFNQDGKFLGSFGKIGDGSGDFSKPKGVALDSEGHIYIADAHFDVVQIFDSQGHLLLGFGNSGRKAGEFYLPTGIYIDQNDRIYVADSYNNRIQIFQYLKEDK